MTMFMKTFEFTGDARIASDSKYLVKFGTTDHNKFMNLIIGSKSISNPSKEHPWTDGFTHESVCLSKMQILQLRDFLNDIYPSEIKDVLDQWCYSLHWSVWYTNWLWTTLGQKTFKNL